MIHTSETGANCFVSYSMSGDVVVEQTRWSNLQGVEITRKVYPDGSGEIILQENSKRTVTIFDGADYSKFVNWVENPPVLNNTENSHNNAVPAGSDLTGSQYKHVYITTNGPITYTRPQMQGWLMFADTYTALAASMIQILHRLWVANYILPYNFSKSIFCIHHCIKISKIMIFMRSFNA